MNKRIILVISIILLLILFNVFGKKDINNIIGTDIMKINYNNLQLKYNSGSGTPIMKTETQDIEKISSLLEHIKSYKFRRTFKSKFSVDTRRAYYVMLDSEKDGFLHIYTIGHKYIGILNRYGENFRGYKVLGDGLNLDFFNVFLNSLVKEDNKEYILADNNGDTIKIPISSIPELENYLSEFSKEEREVEINRIVTNVLDLSENFVCINLSYACGTKLSNHILIKISKGKIETKLLSEASILKDYKISTDKEKVMFIFQRNEGVNVYRNSIKIVKLEDLSEIENKYIQLNYLNQYIWPFENYGWSNSYKIFVKIPDIASTAYEDLESWLGQEDRKSKTININLLK